MRESSDKDASARRRQRNRALGLVRDHRRVRARPIVAGRRYKLTRRCVERRLFLTSGRDAEETNNAIGFCYGVALAAHDQKLHAATVMGNHKHSDITDPWGVMPAFKNHLYSLLARMFNAKRGRFDAFWSADAPCDTSPPTDEESLEDLVYTLTNPVEAGLVKWGHRWPGFTTYGWRFGEVRTFKRPSWFFDPNNPDLPDEVEIRLERPDIFPELSDDELYDRLMKRVRERELEIQVKMKREKRRFVGEIKLLREHWNRAPRSREARFTVAPKVASSSKWARIAQIQRNRDWERRYAEARDAFNTDRDVEFPEGTYWMRRFIRVNVANAPP